ncbi:MAG TPA: hypothetical protein VFJ71_03150 [Candidatus Limnocylindrales bacterium]|nr:hypothetical protein [Candidatus Limnocylindrales bacterium]
MATKTVVCPACGSDTALGRYTCVECGAFLDGIAVQRPPTTVTSTGWDDERPEPLEALPPANDPLLDDGPGLEPAGWDEPVDAVDPTAPPAPDRAPEVQWPPAGTMAPLPVPEPRVPAGSWLPPSAHLTGLEEPEAGGVAAAAALPARTAPAMPRDWLAALGTPETRWAAARRTIAIGSVVGLFGFVLPWGGGSLGNLLTVWLNVWGLAFAGSWLIALGLVTMTALATLSGRVESIPLGVPAIALAALQLGVIWSTLFGASSRPIGILVVLVGAIVLGVGGGLQLGARHEAATPDV